ncbi:hypothetical protein J2X36_002840 [Methylobacterium sp. BE186]|nr:hypothetical protein [Methylobacterium sp. BE186]
MGDPERGGGVIPSLPVRPTPNHKTATCRAPTARMGGRQEGLMAIVILDPVSGKPVIITLPPRDEQAC